MNLRVIPTSVHGVLDYVTGSVLLATPELFRLKDVPPAALAPAWRAQERLLIVY